MASISFGEQIMGVSDYLMHQFDYKASRGKHSRKDACEGQDVPMQIEPRLAPIQSRIDCSNEYVAI